MALRGGDCRERCSYVQPHFHHQHSPPGPIRTGTSLGSGKGVSVVSIAPGADQTQPGGASKVRGRRDYAALGGPFGLSVRSLSRVRETVNDFLQDDLQWPMQLERELFLKEHGGTKNGSYPRSLTTPYGQVELNVPRDREGNPDRAVPPLCSLQFGLIGTSDRPVRRWRERPQDQRHPGLAAGSPLQPSNRQPDHRTGHGPRSVPKPGPAAAVRLRVHRCVVPQGVPGQVVGSTPKRCTSPWVSPRDPKRKQALRAQRSRICPVLGIGNFSGSGFTLQSRQSCSRD